MTPLQDQAARDRFIHELDRNFCVSAGAGVGKTTAIVSRVAQLALREPEALARLVVVTYTNSAAAELRARARTAVLGASAAHPAGQGVLPKLRQAFFGTIHAFCLRLLREHGRGVGLSPAATLLEEEDEEGIWARYCESPALDAVPLDERLLGEVTRFISFDELLRLARAMPAEWAEAVLRTFTRAPRPEVDFSLSLADKGARSVESTRRHQETLRHFLRDLAEGAEFLKIPEPKDGAGTFKKAYQAEIFPLASWLDEQAAYLAAQISLGYRAYRREQRLLTFADQIAWCRRLIEDPATLEALRARDFIILLDEAQDTDASMFAILVEITRAPGSHPGGWFTAAAERGPRPGRFCFVGDEQQAIYSGRANLPTYKRHIDAYAAGLDGERLQFSVTMRCPQRVIGAVNAIFFHQERLRQTHFTFRELHARPACTEGAAWLLSVPPLETGSARQKPEEQFEWECRHVAAFINQYGLRGLGLRQWSDLAILSPRKKWLRAAADIFTAAGLPCRLISQERRQLELPERSWPAAILHVLLNPWDRFELLGVLREVFAISDIDLANAQARNQPLTFWSEAGLTPRLQGALSLLRELHQAAPPRVPGTLSQFTARVLRETALEARLAAIGQRGETLQGLMHAAYCAETAGTPLRDWVRQLARDLHRAAPQVSDAEDEIPILTCQKAKGLEWPAVLPLGLGRALREPSVKYPRLDTGEGTTIHLSPLTVLPENAEAHKQMVREENQRIFYVTLTRAKSLLILPDTQLLYGNAEESFMKMCGWDTLEETPCLFEQPHPLSP